MTTYVCDYCGNRLKRADVEVEGSRAPIEIKAQERVVCTCGGYEMREAPFVRSAIPDVSADDLQTKFLT